MNRELLDQTIENNDLYGRSFTYGVAFKTLVDADYFSFSISDDSIEDIEWNLADCNASALDGDAMKFHNQLSLKQLVAITDIAILDEIVTEYIDNQEQGEDDA